MNLHVGFVMADTSYLKNFESGIAALLRRGHCVTLIVEHQNALGPVIRRLGRHAGFRIQVTGKIQSRWDELGVRLRSVRDYWHYLDPRFANTPALKHRANRLTSPGVLGLDGASPRVRAVASKLVHELEKRLPVPSAYVDHIRALAPDVVLLTPLIYLGSSQVQWLRAANQLGVPSAFCVHSWDNLTTKGILHDMPSAVLVWNSAQCDEAVSLHGVERTRCVITGAPAFDHWFSMQPSQSRDEFLGIVGLPAEKPLLLYLCSSRFIARKEARWVERWVDAVRGAADDRVRSAGVLIRPHPQNIDQWRDWQSKHPGVRVFPVVAESPVTNGARANYFHSLYYADIVIGLNTTALIEAAIFSKPVLSIMGADKAKYRETVHFAHLAKGLLNVAKDVPEHLGQLVNVLNSETTSDRCRQFIDEFVRPCGRDRSAGESMADVVESLAVRNTASAHRSARIA